MAIQSVDQVIPLGAGGGALSTRGGAMSGGGGRFAGGTGLVVLAGVLQLLGFAIPVVVTTTTVEGAVTEFQWTYETFSMHAPGILEWAFYLPALGVATLVAAFLPTQFLRPVLVTLLGAFPLVILHQHPEMQQRLLQRMPVFGWMPDKASALKGLALLAMAVGGGILATRVPKSVAVIAALVAAAPAAIYLGAPLPSEFSGSFAWKSRFGEVLGAQPGDAETGWSVVTGYYMVIAAFALDLLMIGMGAMLALLSLRPAWRRAGKSVGWCVAGSLLTTLLVIAGLAIRPLDDVNYQLASFVRELTFDIKIYLATLGIFLLFPIGLIDLFGRAFGWEY